MNKKYNRLKWACYMGNVTMSVVCVMPALLFAILKKEYNLSYTMIGSLIFINFITQLTMDLFFTFFSYKFNIGKLVKSIPYIASIGFMIYALVPFLLPNYALVGLIIGTIIFSSASGLAEIFLSPVIAAIPSKNPDKEISKLHSLFAWGAVGVTIVSTLILHIVQNSKWYILVFVLMFVPIVSAILFTKTKLPEMHINKPGQETLNLFKNKYMIFFFIVIFLGGASENIISQWSSGYLEKTLTLPKVWGDIFGVAFFLLMLGIGRTLFALKGKNALKTMLIGAIMAVVCYLLLIFTNISFIGILACGFSGYCVAMLWPGSLILVGEKIPKGGVTMFALMAAGGDLGCAIAPQLVGFVTDTAIKSTFIQNLSTNLNLTIEQISMKIGLLFGMIFPILIIVFLIKAYNDKA